MKKLLSCLFVASLAMASASAAENSTTTVKGRAYYVTPMCDFIPMANDTVVVQRFKNPKIKKSVKTDWRGRFTAEFDNRNSSKLVAVYFDDDVTTQQVYNNIKPCRRGECTKTALLVIPDKRFCPHLTGYNTTQ